MNFFGTSIEARGMKAVPKSLSQSAETGAPSSPSYRSKRTTQLAMALGAEAKMEVQAFLDKFNMDTFDFAVSSAAATLRRADSA